MAQAYKVEVRGARGLLPMDPNGQSDPYCLVGLADPETNAFIDPSNVLRSKTHFVTLNPVWKGFSMIAKSAEHKIRVEVWDKDQDVDDDFEGLTIIDLNTIGEEVTDTWLPLVGRTEDEQVTGDVNVVITRGRIEELQRKRSNSLLQSVDIEKAKEQKEEEQRTIKKLTSDLKTKSGRLEQMKETNSVLDLQVVKLKHQVDNLQAELAKKSSALESKEDALAKANAYAVELQKALQEKQNVNKMVQEWNEKAQVLEKMQATLRAKSLQHRKKEEKEEKEKGVKVNAETTMVGEQELKIEKIVEEWTEYALLIETLETEIKEKQQEVEETNKEKQQQASEVSSTIEKLQFDLKEKTEEVEKQKEIQLEKTKRVEETEKELETLRVEIRVKEAQLGAKEENDKQINNVTITIEKLQKELEEKSTELKEQQVRVEEIKMDLQVVEQLKAELKEREEEIERLRAAERERKNENERLLGELEEKRNKIQMLETEIVEQVSERVKEKEEERERLRLVESEITERETIIKEQETKVKDQGIKLIEQETIIKERETKIIEQEGIIKERETKIIEQGEIIKDREIKLKEKETIILEQQNKIGQHEQGLGTNGHTENVTVVENLSLTQNAEAYARLEDELRITKEKLKATEKELETERFRQVDLDVVVARPKQRQEREEVVHDSGGAQFATHIIREESENELLLHKKAKEEKEQEERDSLRDLGVELEELEAAAQKSAPLLAYDELKHSIPKTPEALKAKQRRNCITCV